MDRRTEDIRNFALIGHSGAGKTTLTEALLHRAGAIPQPGSVERGDTVSDFDPQEKSLGYSLGSTVCSFRRGQVEVNLIDTPGFPEFVGRTLSCLEAVETGVVVVSAVDGVLPVTRTMMAKAAELGICRAIVINKIDAPGADPGGALRQVQECFGSECLPLNLPADQGARVVDCYFAPGAVGCDFSSVEGAHTRIVDQVVEVDEALMALYLEKGEELSPDDLHPAFEAALRDRHLTPVCFTSAKSGAGLDLLERVIDRLLPNPLEGNPPAFLDGSGKDARLVEVEPDPASHVVAHVFHVEIDPYLGKMGIFRVHQGTLRAGDQLFHGEARKPFRVGHMVRVMGKQHTDVDLALPGDIRGLVKVPDLHFDAVLHDSHDEDHIHRISAEFPPAMLGVAIEPERRGDEKKLGEGLEKLCDEDQCARVERNRYTHETVLYGLGEVHLRVLLERLEARFHVKVRTHPPSIAYRETVSKPAEVRYRHKKQTGGAGQFGEVALRVEPLERGAGFEFASTVTGGAIPAPLIAAVEKGVRQALAEGALAGFPLQDLRVVVQDGKTHSVDSKEVAFVTAGRKALREAVLAADLVVLEPVVKLDIWAPGDRLGDIAGELSSRRGRVTGNATLPGERVSIEGEVPLAEAVDFQVRLKSLTGGEGEYSMCFARYQEAPPKLQQELAASYQQRRSQGG